MPRMPDDPSSRSPERPRSEPEIIPPGRPAGDGDGFVWTAIDERGETHRIYVARPGPFSVIVALFLAGLALAAVVLVLLSIALFWIPVVIFIIAAFLLSGYIRYYWRRLRYWAIGR